MPREMLERWAACHDERVSIRSFIGWLENHGIELDFDRTDKFPVLDSRKPESLLDLYFEIDQAQLERERRELLAEQRKLLKNA